MNSNMEKEIKEVYLEDILPNRFQPRLTFDQNALNELSESIKQHGVIQPLVLRRLGDKYEIIAGERRYKAAQMAGLKTVPCIIMDLDDNKSAEIAIVENIQRKEMTPLEEARSFKKLLDRGYLTQEQLATRMGKSQSSIANKLRLLNLDEEIQDALLNEKISERHARSLLSIKDNVGQKEMLREILNKKLTVKQTDDLIKEKYGVIEDTTSTTDTQNKGITEFNNSQTPILNKETPEFNNSQIPTLNKELLNKEPETNVTQATIPNPYKEVELNPQVALINKLNNANTNSDIVTSQPAESIVNPVDFNVASNPYVAPDLGVKEEPYIVPTPNLEINKVKEEPFIVPTSDIDINKMKEEAKDIIEPTLPAADIGNLLKVDEINKEEPKVESKNRFILDLDDIEVLDFNENETKEEEVKEPIIKEEPKDVRTTVDLIKNNINSLKENGINIELEEFDFENFYQMIIKIDK